MNEGWQRLAAVALPFVVYFINLALVMPQPGAWARAFFFMFLEVVTVGAVLLIISVAYWVWDGFKL